MSTNGEGEHEAEGVRAFLRLSAAIERLDWRLNTHEEAQQRLLREQQGGVERAAAVLGKAQEAAQKAVEAVRSSKGVVMGWAALTAVLGVLTGLGGGYLLGQGTGFAKGHDQGVRESHDAQAAASWANTPTGRLARKLDEAGSLTMLTSCSGQGWQTQRRDGRSICWPYAAREGQTPQGWYLQ